MSRGALGIVKKHFPEVTSIEDAKANATIEVSSADIKHSTVRNHNSCALAIACKRKLKADGVVVSVSVAYVIKGRKAIRYRVPESLSREIIAFDRDGKFAPGDYILTKPDKAHELGRHLGSNDYIKGNGKSKGKVPYKHLTEGIRTSLVEA